MQPRLTFSLYTLFLLVIPGHTYADYTVGDGLENGDLFLSGYSKIEWEAPVDKPQELLIDDLSFFASASFNWFLNPFIEAEITNVQLWKEGDGLGIKNSYLNDFIMIFTLMNKFSSGWENPSLLLVSGIGSMQHHWCGQHSAQLQHAIHFLNLFQVLIYNILSKTTQFIVFIINQIVSG